MVRGKSVFCGGKVKKRWENTNASWAWVCAHFWPLASILMKREPVGKSRSLSLIFSPSCPLNLARLHTHAPNLIDSSAISSDRGCWVGAAPPAPTFGSSATSEAHISRRELGSWGAREPASQRGSWRVREGQRGRMKLRERRTKRKLMY